MQKQIYHKELEILGEKKMLLEGFEPLSLSTKTWIITLYATWNNKDRQKHNTLRGCLVGVN